MNNEDIKILEEKIKIIESLCTDDCINKSTVIDPLKYALENLITRYKQLEEENKELIETYKSEKTMKNNYVQYYQDLLLKENCIPKSKVKEKMKEIKSKGICKNTDFCNNSCFYYSTCNVLQDLLEEE